MVKKVDINETLLKSYNDKELINYIVGEMRSAYEFKSKDEVTDLSILTYRMARVGSCIDLLEAVNKRMNKDAGDPKIVL